MEDAGERGKKRKKKLLSGCEPDSGGESLKNRLDAESGQRNKTLGDRATVAAGTYARKRAKPRARGS